MDCTKEAFDIAAHVIAIFAVSLFSAKLLIEKLQKKFG